MRPELNTLVWQLSSWFVLLIFMLIGCIEDIKKKRISNYLVLGLLCSGVALNTLAPHGAYQGLLTPPHGPLGTRLALLGSCVGLALLLPLYRLRACGAGDLKLLGAIGSFFGPVDILNVTLSILVTGGCWATVKLLCTAKTRSALANIARLVKGMTTRKAQNFDPVTQSIERMPFVPAMTVGLLVYGLWRWWGGAALLQF